MLKFMSNRKGHIKLLLFSATHQEGVCGAKRLLLLSFVGVVGIFASFLFIFGFLASSVSAQTASVFSPSVSITVPQFDDDGDGVNDFSEQIFTISFAPISGSDSGCTQTATSNYTVSNSGAVSTDAQVSLVDRPAGLDAQCEYLAAFPQMVGSLALQPSTSFSVYAASLSVSATYLLGTNSVFSPSVSIAVPGFGGDLGDVLGLTFVVGFEAVAGSNGGCSGVVSSVFVVVAGGSVSLAENSSLPTLVDRPAGEDVRCVYDVSLPSRVGVLKLRDVAAVTVSAGSALVSAVYDSVFYPQISFLEVPRIDDDGDGVNDFSGQRFTVGFRKTFNTFNTADRAHCSEPASSVFVVRDDGSVSLADNSSLPALADWLTGSRDRCSYQVSLPSRVGSLRLRQPPTYSTISISAVTSIAGYFGKSTTRFSPSVAVTVPQFDDDGDGVNDFSGQRFTVHFSRSGSSRAFWSCPTSVAPSVFVVGDDGSVSLADNSSFPALVDRPSESPFRCKYTMGLLQLNTPASVLLPRYGTRENSRPSFSAAAPAVSASYIAPVSTFQPSVSIAVPQVDADGAGGNDYAGLFFNVQVSPTAGSSSGCTQPAQVIVGITPEGNSYIVRTYTSDLRSYSSIIPIFIDHPEGVENRCSYNVTFPPQKNLLSLQPATTLTITAAAPAVTANYNTQFTPQTTATVPWFDDNANGVSDFSERNVRPSVSFIPVPGSNASCSRSTAQVFKISANGAVSLAGNSSLPILVDRPAGTDVRCSYKVFISEIGTSDETLGKGVVIRPNAQSSSTVVTAAAPAVSATYVYHTWFSPTVSIEVPQVNDSSGNNIYLDERFIVRFSPTAASNNNCTQALEVILQISSTGSSYTSESPRLIDRIQGVGAPCEYLASFPPHNDALQLQAGSTRVVGASSPAASAVYH